MANKMENRSAVKNRIVEMAAQDPGLPLPDPSVAFWQEPPHPISSVQSDSLPTQVDYAIIGSGITGCSVANTLLNQKALSEKRVAVFEARALTSGATGRNGGHLVSPAAADFAMLASTFGVDNAVEAARFSYRSIDRVYEFVSTLDENIQDAAEVRKVQTVINFLDSGSFAHCQESVRQFQEACPELNNGVKVHSPEAAKEVISASLTSSLERWKENRLIQRQKFNFAESCGALEGPAGALWPYRLITGVLAKLLQEHSTRFSIDTHTPITKVEYNPENSQYPYRLETPRGFVEAAGVVYCMNGFTSHLLPSLRGKIFPLRGTMSTQILSPAAPNHGADYSWSLVHEPTFDPETGGASIGLYYMTQNAKTGDFYLGGETQRYEEILVSDDTVVPALPADNLTSLMTKIFQAPPEAEEYKTTPKRIWSGIMGFTADMMPLVGQLGDKWTGNSGDGEWIAAGFNGHGMDKCWLIGETLGAMIAGEDVTGRLPRVYQVTDQRLEEGMSASRVPEILFQL